MNAIGRVPLRIAATSAAYRSGAVTTNHSRNSHRESPLRSEVRLLNLPNGSPTSSKAPKVKRRISPAGMRRIVAATKNRWRLQKVKAAKKAAAKKTAPAPAVDGKALAGPLLVIIIGKFAGFGGI